MNPAENQYSMHNDILDVHHPILEGGSNVGANTIFGPEPLFGDPITQCAGEPLGVVVWFSSEKLLSLVMKIMYMAMCVML
jgi:hypothetical protein